MTKQEINHDINPYDAMHEKSRAFSSMFNTIKPHADLTECSVRVILETGEICLLTSNLRYHDDISKQFKSSKKRLPAIRNLKNFKQTGMYLLSSEPAIREGMGKTITKTLEEHDMNHAITIVTLFNSQRGNAILLCTLSTNKASQHIYRFYLNHQNEIKKFIVRLTRHLDDLIQNLAFIKPTTQEIKLTKEAFQRLHLSEKSETIENESQQYTTNITQREKEVIYWYLKGKSAEQTAKILGITNGTVRTYFERLKTKLGCYYKPQIIIKLINAGFIRPNDWENSL